MSRRRIIVLIDWYLPGTKAGGPVRSVFSVVNALKPYYDIYLITGNNDLGSVRPYSEVRSDEPIAADGITYYYLSDAKIRKGEVLHLINYLNPELIYLNSMWSYQFSIRILRWKKNKFVVCPVLLAPRGMLGKGALGLKSFKKQLFILAAKIIQLYRGVQFHATNVEEKIDVLKKFPRTKVFVTPNLSLAGIVANKTNKTIFSIRMFYLSRIARVKNLKFAIDCLLHINPDVTVQYDIYGNKEDAEYWSECENAIRKLPSNVKVAYKSELRFDEVQRTASTYHALFLPTLNENYGHSIVESLFSGCPVIISDQTPWRDLATENAGFDLPIGNALRFKTAIEQLASLDQTGFDQYSKNAINYISKRVQVDDTIAKYRQMFDESLKNRPFDL